MPREPALPTSAAESLGVVLCTTTVSRSRRRDGGESARNAWRSAVGIERVEPRMGGASVRRRGVGSPEAVTLS
jgi:hypothetical protein